MKFVPMLIHTRAENKEEKYVYVNPLRVLRFGTVEESHIRPMRVGDPVGSPLSQKKKCTTLYFSESDKVIVACSVEEVAERLNKALSDS